MGKKELSSWIRSGVVEKEIKDTLGSTLNALHDACPLRKSHKSIRNSLHDLLYSDNVFRQSSPAHIMIFGWFEDNKLSSSSSSSSQKQSKPFAVFKKTRFHSSAVGQQATITNNYEYNRTARDPSPSIKQSFSFTDSEQGAIIESFINLTENVIYNFLVNNESNIPLEVVESFANKQRPPISKDFCNADLLCMLNFILENINIFIKKSLFHGQHKANPTELLTDFKRNVINKLSHGIVINENGRWSDHALQHVTILACEVIICLGGNYEKVFANKENFDSEIIKRSDDSSKKRKLNKVLDDKENINTSQKRLCDADLGKMTEWLLDILEDLEETKKEDKKKILKLTMDENEYVSKCWKAIQTEERKIQVHKFIKFANVMFDVNLKAKN